MATRRKGVSKSRVTTRSSGANELPPDAMLTVDQETASPERKSSSSSTSGFYDVAEDDGCCWSTPKAKRFRIPEMETCPPAPKKQRASNVVDDWKRSIRRSSIPFFKPPHELAEFFFRVSPFQICHQSEG